MTPRGRYDAVIVGAGISGLYLLHRLRELGLSVLVVDFLPAPMWQWAYPYAAYPVAARNLYNNHMLGWVRLAEKRFMSPKPL